MIHKYAEIFRWKNVSSFCSAEATHIFSAKNIRILYIESAKTVNEMTLNELVSFEQLGQDLNLGPLDLQSDTLPTRLWRYPLHYLFVLRFYGPFNPMRHVERSQFT